MESKQEINYYSSFYLTRATNSVITEITNEISYREKTIKQTTDLIKYFEANPEKITLYKELEDSDLEGLIVSLNDDIKELKAIIEKVNSYIDILKDNHYVGDELSKIARLQDKFGKSVGIRSLGIRSLGISFSNEEYYTVKKIIDKNHKKMLGGNEEIVEETLLELLSILNPHGIHDKMSKEEVKTLLDTPLKQSK